MNDEAYRINPDPKRQLAELKVAAAMFKAKFVLAQKRNGVWQVKEVRKK